MIIVMIIVINIMRILIDENVVDDCAVQKDLDKGANHQTILLTVIIHDDGDDTCTRYPITRSGLSGTARDLWVVVTIKMISMIGWSLE